MKIVRVFTALAALTALSACAASPVMDPVAPVTPAPTVAVPPPPPPVVAAPVEMEAQPLVVYFDLNKSDISASTMQVLHGAAPALKAAQPAVIRIHGFTDSAGKSSYNRRLSEKRAKAVADQLRKLGITAETIEVAGHGSEKSTVTRKGRFKEARDRRVEISWEPKAKTSAVQPEPHPQPSPVSTTSTIGMDGVSVGSALAVSGQDVPLPAPAGQNVLGSAGSLDSVVTDKRVAGRRPTVRGPPPHPLA